MFVDAIEKVSGFTRPIMFITRNYNSSEIIPGLGTLFFVNGDGVAVTCKHVANMMLNADKVNANYAAFKKERGSLNAANVSAVSRGLKILEKKYNLSTDKAANVKVNFLDVPSPFTGFTVHMHPKFDLAVIKFNGFTDLNYIPDDIYLLGDSSKIKQGKSLCRLGYPFPEFSNFVYNKEKDDIEFTADHAAVPRFPIDGIVTRHIMNKEGELFGIEMSTPGLRGQSGGPLFDKDGVIYGMQFATQHLHLGFDMENIQMDLNGKKKLINNQPFLHVGQCLHIDIIKRFLDSLGIEYRVK